MKNQNKSALIKAPALFIFALFTFFPLYAQPQELAPVKYKVRVVNNNTELKLKPADESLVIMKLPLGSTFDAIDEVGSFIKIKLPPDKNGIIITGYVLSDFVEVEPNLITPVNPPIQKIIESPPVSTIVSASTMDYTDWKIRLDRAKNTTSGGIAALGGGIVVLVVLALMGEDVEPGVKTSSLISGAAFTLTGIMMIASGSQTVKELEQQGIRQGYQLSANTLARLRQKRPSILFSYKIAF